MELEVQRERVESELRAWSGGPQGCQEGGHGASHLRSCLRRAKISSLRRADPSSAVSTLRCSLAFSPTSLRLLSSRSSRLLSRSAGAGLRAGKGRGQQAWPRPPFPGGGGEMWLFWRKRSKGDCRATTIAPAPHPLPQGPQALHQAPGQQGGQGRA